EREQSFGRCVFPEEPGRSCLQRLVDVLIEVEGGEHDHARTFQFRRQDLACGLEPVEVRHANVEQQDVGVQQGSLFDCLDTVTCLADYLDVLVGVDDRAQCGTRESVVVCDQHANAHGPISSSGIRPRMAYPPSGRGPASSFPPYIAALSRIPASPRPRPARTSALRAGPSSTISRSSAASLQRTMTAVCAVTVCLSTFVSASWTMR